MGFYFAEEGMTTVLEEWKKDYLIYGPVRMAGGNTFSAVDCILYGTIQRISDVVFDQKSDYSFKEVLLPLSQTLFFFTEDHVKDADAMNKGAIIFLRS